MPRDKSVTHQFVADLNVQLQAWVLWVPDASDFQEQQRRIEERTYLSVALRRVKQGKTQEEITSEMSRMKVTYRLTGGSAHLWGH
jgi:hypothetical protein